jgi:hypothetical protein
MFSVQKSLELVLAEVSFKTMLTVAGWKVGVYICDRISHSNGFHTLYLGHMRPCGVWIINL